MRWLNESIVNAEKLCPAGEFDSMDFLVQPAQRPFAAEALAFIADFSNEIAKNGGARRYPEIVALGFWMRRANIASIQTTFETTYRGRHLVGKGLVFHIAPSNVDTMFIYSLFLSILAGNTNIVRVSTKLGEQFECLISLLNIVLARHCFIARRLLLVRYGHDDQVTGFFSSLCHARVIWGGDNTISRIRAIPLPPRAFELTFSGKFSIAVLAADAWNAAQNPDAVAKLFCNDAFIFNQQGCASPKLVYWLGMPESVALARTSFWPTVERVLTQMPSYALEPADAMNRLVAVCSIAVNSSAMQERIEASNHLFVSIKVPDLTDVFREENTGNGLFYEFEANSLDPLLAWCGDSDQTICSYGISPEQWHASLCNHTPKGICRIVRLGQALIFSPVWDGYDIIRYLSREVVIEL